MRFRTLRLLGLGAVLVASSVHAADPVPSIDLRGYTPPLDPKGFIYVEPSSTPGPGNLNAGAYASYALKSVVLKDASGNVISTPVLHQVSLDYLINVGLGQRWAAGISVPTVMYQTGDDPRSALPGSTALPPTTFGDLSIGLKRTLLAPSDLGGFGIAALGRMWLPTGDPRSYVSDGSVRGELRLLGDVDLLAIAVRATAGARLRAQQQTLIRDGTDRYTFGNDLPWGVGVTLRPQVFGVDPKGHMRVTAEFHGAVALDPKFASGPQSPIQAGLSSRYTLGDASLLAAVEFPLDGAVGNPLVHAIVGVDWAPRFLDADKDGIQDDDDECPELEEDLDGFEDSDGCPDFDNDDDGVSDDADKCPKEKEDADDFQDDDGCEDPDNDGDGVLDKKDACPNEKGPATGKKPGCPDQDRDRDRIPNDKDKCPDAAEDRDGFEDADGCPEPDNDADSVLDPLDACPTEKGEPSPFAELRGCPILDHDGDTIDDADDKCPKEPEDFQGVTDDDGCPDQKPGVPLVAIEDGPNGNVLKWRIPPRFVKDGLDQKTLPTLRALASELNLHPEWIVAVGVRPVGRAAAAEQLALNRAFSLVLTLRWLTHRDTVAETLGWSAVKDLPTADKVGIGVLILSPKKAPVVPAAPPPRGEASPVPAVPVPVK
jgi:hypothetical protein